VVLRTTFGTGLMDAASAALEAKGAAISAIGMVMLLPPNDGGVRPCRRRTAWSRHRGRPAAVFRILDDQLQRPALDAAGGVDRGDPELDAMHHVGARFDVGPGQVGDDPDGDRLAGRIGQAGAPNAVRPSKPAPTASANNLVFICFLPSC